MDATTQQSHATASPRSRVTAWDLPTRIFHWLLVTMVLFAWISFRYSESFSDYLLKMHRWNGLAILTLLVWRLLWGIAGSSTSRFTSFVSSPGAALAYGRDLIIGHTRRFLGHNPLGAWMVIALLAALLVQGTLGLFTVEENDMTAGPLYRLVSEATTKFASRWHDKLFYWVLLPLIVLHISANLFYGLVKREPIVPAMITGKKPAANYEDEAEARQGRHPLLRAAALLVLAALIVLGGIRLLAGRLI